MWVLSHDSSHNQEQRGPGLVCFRCSLWRPTPEDCWWWGTREGRETEGIKDFLRSYSAPGPILGTLYIFFIIAKLYNTSPLPRSLRRASSLTLIPGLPAVGVVILIFQIRKLRRRSETSCAMSPGQQEAGVGFEPSSDWLRSLPCLTGTAFIHAPYLAFKFPGKCLNLEWDFFYVFGAKIILILWLGKM